MWVDTGVTGPETPLPLADYTFVYQGASVSLTTAQLLSNDSDPQNQPLTVVSVSEPGIEGVLTGDSATGFAFTPSLDPTLIDTDHALNYLVTDTDGHVAQSNIIIRILANEDPNRPPVAVPDTASTTGEAINVFTTGNDFDPDGDAFSVVNIVNPAHGTASAFGSGFTYTPNAGLLRRRGHHLHSPRHPRTHLQRPRRRSRQRRPATTDRASRTTTPCKWAAL